MSATCRRDIALLPGTISENIARFRSLASMGKADLDRQVVAAAQMAGAHEMILQLPQRL